MGLGSGIPDLGVKKAPDPGYAILPFMLSQLGWFLLNLNPDLGLY
jgi:hypothetical protein